MILSMSLIRFLNRSNRIRHRRSIAVGQVELHILLLRMIVRSWDEMRIDIDKLELNMTLQLDPTSDAVSYSMQWSSHGLAL